MTTPAPAAARPVAPAIPGISAEALAAAIASTTIEPTAEPVTTPRAAASAEPPARPPATIPATRPPARPPVEVEAEDAADAVASGAEPDASETAQTNPQAPALSPYPARRSSAALTRFTQAAQRARQAPTTAAAGGSSSAGQASGGLCGIATLEGRRLPRITSPVQGCGVAEPVSVTAVAGVRLSQPATLDCDTARAFDRWVRQVMQPAMGRSGGGVTQIRVAAHYICRPRNNRAGARVSEHGRGRAIDIAGFRLASGQTVMVLTDWARGPHAQALRQMHASACGIFRTTLGPGSDGHHEDHFHFDMAARSNNSTYCR